jgi:hypothetical protein
MGVPAMGGFQQGFGGFQGQQTQQTSAMQSVPQTTNNYGTSQLFGNQPQQPYQSAFGAQQEAAPVQPQVQTPPQPSAIETDQRGVPAFLRRKK